MTDSSTDPNPETAPPFGRKKWLAVLASAAIVAATGAGIWAAFAPAPVKEVVEKRDSFFTSSYFKYSSRGYDDFSGVGARPMPLCRGGRQDNCIIDGDTFWLNGQQIRIANADAPALDGACAEEIGRARDAVATLSDLLDDQPIEIRSQGRSRTGALLAKIKTPEGDVGANLVRFRVAVPWNGRREPDTDWCKSG